MSDEPVAVNPAVRATMTEMAASTACPQCGAPQGQDCPPNEHGNRDIHTARYEAFMASEEVRVAEERNRAELKRLNAKPWRAACVLCPGMLWFADSEEEARRLADEHVTAEHDLVMAWRNHD